MKKIVRLGGTGLDINNSYIAESLEEKIMRKLNNGEPTDEGVELIFTEKADGVNQAYDIRRDKFEIALDATDGMSRTKTAKGDGLGKMKVVKDDEKEDGGAESIGGTEIK